MRITTGRNVAAPRRGGPRDLALAFSPLLQQRLGVGHADATKAVSLWVWLQDSCQKAGWTYVPLPPGPPPSAPALAEPGLAYANMLTGIGAVPGTCCRKDTLLCAGEVPGSAWTSCYSEISTGVDHEPRLH